MDSDDSSSDGGLAKIFKRNSISELDSINLMMTELKQHEKDHILMPHQTKMIENILNFQYITASDIMTHRIDILAVEENSTVANVVDLSHKKGLSRIPVYRQNIDTIIGAVFVKDLLKPLVDRPQIATKKITQFIRQLLYVPKSTKCIDLFFKLTKTHKHLAVVVDDFGGTFGIVTMEDIIETVFGKIQDEFDNEKEEIVKISENTYIIQGFANLKNVFDVLNLKINQSLNYETLNGFLIDLIGRIPGNNELPIVEYQNIEFSVLAMEKHHIEKVKAIKLH